MTKATDNQIINAALSSVTMHEAARTCSLHPTSFILRAKRLGVYKPNPGRVGVIRSKDEYKNIRIPLHEILQGKHPQYSTSHLRRRLFDEFNWERKCEKCFTDDQGISFELDHKDGDHTNHKFGNLQILCPNCHSKTPTFAGRNKKRKKIKTFEIQIIKLLLKNETTTEILTKLDLTPNGVNYRRVDRLRTITEYIQKH